jgi:prepilin-type N-terminal cleavage/methylation domain-containing protein
MKSRAGFTLVELVGALAIISILVGMVLVTTGNSRDRALQTRISADLEAINAAKGFWVLDHNGAAFPSDEPERFNAIRKYLEVNRSFSALVDYQPPGVNYSINGIGVPPSHSP